MSQSDYIKRKQVAHTLRIDGGETNNHQPAVFSSHDLLKYKQYQIVNDDSNTIINYNNLTRPGKIIVFDIERDVTNCPEFIVCNNTNDRPNRVLRIEIDPLQKCPVQILPLSWEQKKNVPVKSKLCKCQLRRKHMNKNVCSCDIKSVV